MQGKRLISSLTVLSLMKTELCLFGLCIHPSPAALTGSFRRSDHASGWTKIDIKPPVWLNLCCGSALGTWFQKKHLPKQNSFHCCTAPRLPASSQRIIHLHQARPESQKPLHEKGVRIMLETMEKTKKRYWHEDMCRPTRFDKFVFVLVLVFLFLKMSFFFFKSSKASVGNGKI